MIFFSALWGLAFTERNINSAFKNTGLNPLNPEIVLQRFNRKSQSRPSFSNSTASVIKAEDWRKIQQFIYNIADNRHDHNIQKLKNTVMALSTENILLKLRLDALEQAFMNEKKRRARKKSILLNLPSADDDGALFLSPQKVQQYRDQQLQKDQLAAEEQARKSEKKLQQQLIK